MNGFRAWLFDFMRGRYGFDELGRHLSIVVVVLIIVSIVIGVVASLLYDLARLFSAAVFLNLVSTVVNWVSIALLIWTFYRMLSRNIAKRRAENARYLERRCKRGHEGRRASRRATGTSHTAQAAGAAAGPEGAAGYDYLNCPFCGQRMRVPQGRGKIAVKCPSCGEKTIHNS